MQNATRPRRFDLKVTRLRPVRVGASTTTRRTITVWFGPPKGRRPRRKGDGRPPSPKLIACLLGLHLSNEGLRDASGEMACNRVNEFDEINMMIGFIRDGSNHNKRDTALVTHLSHRGTLHFYAECVR